MSWIYHQSTGELTHNGVRVATGYSGTGNGRNNPDDEALPNVGPIPRGNYRIGDAHNTATHGPQVMALTPEGNTTHGRDGFLIHGDNVRHDASQGCIILPPDVRGQISRSRDRELQVVR